MKQKGQAKQNTNKELKQTPNWTSSAETVAPDTPVTEHRSNRLAADTPVPYHRCNGPSNAQPSRETQVSPDKPVRSKRGVGAFTMLSLREHVKQPRRSSSAPVTPVVTGVRHRCNVVTVARGIVAPVTRHRSNR